MTGNHGLVLTVGALLLGLGASAGCARDGEESERAAPTARASLPGLIAYESYEPSGHRAIYVMKPDGTGKRRLRKGVEPAWSPDGERIAFSDGDADIFVMNANGSGVRNLTQRRPGTGMNVSPSWSPDGRRIAFTSERDWYELDEEGMSIYVMKADGSGVRRLTRGRADYEPAWSPDGTRIVFTDGSDIAVMNADGSGRKKLTRFEKGTAHEPAWSPDSRTIAFRRCCFEPVQISPFLPDGEEIYLVDTDGGRLRRLLDRGAVDGQAHPAWSPDGRWIALSGHGYHDRPYDHLPCDLIYVVGIESDDARALTRCTSLDPKDPYYWLASAYDPSWGPATRAASQPR